MLKYVSRFCRGKNACRCLTNHWRTFPLPTGRWRTTSRAFRSLPRLTNYVHASAVHGNKLTVMYAVGRRKDARVRESGGDDEKEEKDVRLRPRERDAIVIYANKLGPGRFMVQYITAMMNKVMTSDDPEGRRRRMKVYPLVIVAFATADW